MTHDSIHQQGEEAPRKRRLRYKGTHPRRFEEKYKELNREKYSQDVEKIIQSGKTPAGSHRPICVQEILEILDPKPGQTGVDATLGYGGHAVELLKRILPGGRLWGLDVDPIEIVRTETRLRGLGFTEKELVIRRINFAGIPKLLADAGGGFDFILADLGVSSMQLDDPSRGFTYKVEGPLDLRLNPTRGNPASVLLRSLSESEIEKLLWLHSDEPHAKAIAKSIYKHRDILITTTALADIVRDALPGDAFRARPVFHKVRHCDCAARKLADYRGFHPEPAGIHSCRKPGAARADNEDVIGFLRHIDSP